MNNSKKLTIIALTFIVLSVAVAAVASAQDEWEDYYGDEYMTPFFLGSYWRNVYNPNISNYNWYSVSDMGI